MMPWSTFWQWLIVGCLAIFTVLAAFVTIGGARDILTMFRRIDRQHEQSDED